MSKRRQAPMLRRGPGVFCLGFGRQIDCHRPVFGTERGGEIAHPTPPSPTTMGGRREGGFTQGGVERDLLQQLHLFRSTPSPCFPGSHAVAGRSSWPRSPSYQATEGGNRASSS